MEPWLLAIVLFGAMFLVLALGLPVAFTLGGLSLAIGYFIMGAEAGFFAFTLSSFGKLTEFTITALPLFILMAAVLQHSGLADDTYEMVYRWMGGIKGGLAMGTIIISAIFAAMVGIATVATATLGLTALPSMLKRGYDKRMICGAICAGGALGVLIPPSVLMIIYASETDVSAGQMFLAGIMPGILLAALYIIYIAVRARSIPPWALPFEWLGRMHPVRLGYELLSDRNPAVKPLASEAERVRNTRQPVSADNAFLQYEKIFSDWITSSLDAFRDWRDMLTEQMFFGIYGQPWMQALLGLRASDDPPRHHPGRDSDHAAFVERRIEELRAKMDQGGPREAALRALVYVGMPEKGTDEREFEMLRQIRAEHGSEKSLAEFKQDLREQYYMLRIDERRAIELIPKLLQGHEEKGPQLLEHIRRIVYADGSLGEEGQRRLAEVERLFTEGD